MIKDRKVTERQFVSAIESLITAPVVTRNKHKFLCDSNLSQKVLVECFKVMSSNVVINKKRKRRCK